MAIPARPIFGIPSLPVETPPVVAPPVATTPGAAGATPASWFNASPGGGSGYQDFIKQLTGTGGLFSPEAISAATPGFDLSQMGRGRRATGYYTPLPVTPQVHPQKTFADIYAKYFPMLGKLLGGLPPTAPVGGTAPVAPTPVVGTPQPTVPAPTGYVAPGRVGIPTTTQPIQNFSLNSAGLLPYLNGLAAR